MRDSFLEEVPAHQAIRSAWKQSHQEVTLCQT
jgi:hypothetical protein